MHLLVYFTLSCFVTNVARAKPGRQKRTIIGTYPLCPRGCTSCSSFNGCVTCKPRMFMLLERKGMRQTGSCVHACPQGYYGVQRKQYSKCYKCRIENCKTCFSRNYCTECESPYLAHNGKCVKACPPAMYYAGHSKTCQYKVDCAISPWSTWGPCVKNGQSCGYKYGITTRKRRVLDFPSPNGTRCPATTNSKRCKMRMRYCEDLLHNKSDPSQLVRKRRRRKRKKKKKRRKKHERRRLRKKRIRLYGHDVSSNHIRALLIDSAG